MLYWREAGRPVVWTKEGKLVYDETPELDPELKRLKEVLHCLVIAKHVDGITNQQLYEVCKALALREKELTRDGRA